MELADFDFSLPPELVAQEPLEVRSASRLLIIDRTAGTFTDGNFVDIRSHLRAGDVLVLNNTKVIPARLFGTTETGAKVEAFLVEDLGADNWEVLARPARRLSAGKKIIFSDLLSATVIERTEQGHVLIRFEGDGDINQLIETTGRTPLPPYIARNSSQIDTDRERYQTVFAKELGAIAAPTAGLHFTPEILGSIAQMGVQTVEVTLHVGYGTFEPVRAERLADHRVLPEKYEINAETAETLSAALSDGRRIVAVGTTTTRTLESNIDGSGRFSAKTGVADLTVTPGYKFRAVSALLTNFHLPKSSLLVLTSTFGGHRLIMDAYNFAVSSRYRFYSYGDCMLII